jgi:hypothetical protein
VNLRRELEKHWRLAAAAVVVLALAGAGIGVAIAHQNQDRSHAKLLNKPTKAREVRPFSTKRDPRFAPLPLEREKH